MVCRCAGRAVELSGTGAHGAGHLLRQPHRGGAVSPRRVPDSRRYVSAVSRHRRDQLARRLAGRGGPYAHGGAARLLRGHRASALAPCFGAPLCRRHHGPGRAGPRLHTRALRVGPVAGIFEGSRPRVDAPAQRTGRRHRRAQSVSGARDEPPAARDHCGAPGAAGRLPARRAAVRVLQPERRSGRLRRRARASAGARDGRRPRLRARGPRPHGSPARGGVLRPRDVGRGDHHGSRPRGPVLGVVSGRNHGVRRAGRPARTVCELGRDPRAGRTDDRRVRRALLRAQAPGAVAARHDPGARGRHRAAVRPRRRARRRAGAARRAWIRLDADAPGVLGRRARPRRRSGYRWRIRSPNTIRLWRRS